MQQRLNHFRMNKQRVKLEAEQELQQSEFKKELLHHENAMQMA